MPLLDLFWTMLFIFLWFVWIWLLISVFADIFRSDMSGWLKAGWVFFVIVLPYLGVFIYLIANGSDMQDRARRAQAEKMAAQRQYIQEAAETSSSSADELKKLADLHDRGYLDDQEFAAEKARLLA